MSTATKHLSGAARQAISAAWNQGGARAVAASLGLDPRYASRLVSNLRRSNPDLFPRRRAKVHQSRRRLIREAIQLVEAMPQTTATALVVQLLNAAMPKGTRKGDVSRDATATDDDEKGR